AAGTVMGRARHECPPRGGRPARYVCEVPCHPVGQALCCHNCPVPPEKCTVPAPAPCDLDPSWCGASAPAPARVRGAP
ncbi:MAG: hypothetical protein AB1578_22790, partial [Thermodesulfobacteriota bacterium]